MTRIAPVKFLPSQKAFWFDAGDIEIQKDERVVVDTVRGMRIGTLSDDIFEGSEEELSKKAQTLRCVLRKATSDDECTCTENKELEEEALIEFKKLIVEEKKDMRAVDVEFSLDRKNAIFYFEAEERIDFRSVVKKLASKYHTHVDMRQISARERARHEGGFGVCGQELCCTRFHSSFSPISIRMAKEQGLSLNQQKIAGCCGRLMCCLNYEYEEYKKFNKRAPKMNAKISTPDGIARVCGIDMIHETISLRVEDGAHNQNNASNQNNSQNDNNAQSKSGESTQETI